MYKISQVAEILNVPTVQIHEKLIFLKKDLKECIHKKSAITYIDDKGMIILKKAFESEVIEKSHVFDEIKDVIIEEEVSSESDKSGELSNFEETYDKKVLLLKEKIGRSKSDISKLDIEIKRLDEAFLHYQEILKDDIEWRNAEEEKLKNILTTEKPDLVEEPANILKEDKVIKKSLFNSLRNK